MKKSHIVLTITSIVLAVAALVVGIVAIVESRQKPITDAYQIGLGFFFEDTITEMYVDGGYSPNVIGNFYDETVLTKVRDIFKVGCFQEASGIKNIFDTGDTVTSIIVFTGQMAEYGFSFGNGLVRVRIDDSDTCYYTNIGYVMEKIILDVSENLSDYQNYPD